LVGYKVLKSFKEMRFPSLQMLDIWLTNKLKTSLNYALPNWYLKISFGINTLKKLSRQDTNMIFPS